MVGRGETDGRAQTFGGLWIVFVQEPTTVFLIKHGGEAPWALLKRLHVLDLDNEDVTGLCALDLERTGKVVHAGQVTVLDVVGTVIVLDLSAGPVYALDLDGFSWDYLAHEGNWVGRLAFGSNRVSERKGRGTVGVPAVLK